MLLGDRLSILTKCEAYLFLAEPVGKSLISRRPSWDEVEWGRSGCKFVFVIQLFSALLLKVCHKKQENEEVLLTLRT